MEQFFVVGLPGSNIVGIWKYELNGKASLIIILVFSIILPLIIRIFLGCAKSKFALLLTLITPSILAIVFANIIDITFTLWQWTRILFSKLFYSPILLSIKPDSLFIDKIRARFIAWFSTRK